jgi:hypothetical protein
MDGLGSWGMSDCMLISQTLVVSKGQSDILNSMMAMSSGKFHSIPDHIQNHDSFPPLVKLRYIYIYVFKFSIF